MNEVGAERQAEIEREIQSIFPEVDWHQLVDQINEILDCYDLESFISRDTHPTRQQMIHAIEQIHGDLESILKRLCAEDGGAILHFMNKLMYEPDKDISERSVTGFSSKLSELYITTKVVLELLHENKDEFKIRGSTHKRRTRTSVRDKVLIPRLSALACRQGLSPSDDWEDLDKTCNFVKLTLEYVGISTPDAGQDVAKHGEVAQGRLRRMIKEAARQHQETGKIDK